MLPDKKHRESWFVKFQSDYLYSLHHNPDNR